MCKTQRISTYLCLFLLFFLNIPPPLSSQVPFESIRIGTTAEFHSGGDRLYQLWRPTPGPELFLQTPFYYGSVRGGCEFYRFFSSSSQRPDFFLTIFFLQWLLERHISTRFYLSAGARFGMIQWRFDRLSQDDLPMLLVEHELSAGCAISCGYRMTDNWRLEINGCRQMVMTRHKIYLQTFGVGLSRSFQTPGWLAEVLR